MSAQNYYGAQYGQPQAFASQPAGFPEQQQYAVANPQAGPYSQAPVPYNAHNQPLASYHAVDHNHHHHHHHHHQQQQQHHGQPSYVQPQQQQHYAHGALPPSGQDGERGLGASIIGGGAAGWAMHKAGGGFLGSLGAAAAGAVGANAIEHAIKRRRRQHKKKKHHHFGSHRGIDGCNSGSDSD
ncbi:hypothetical protein HIM_00943 [Hirsutella minnesotensis 3608]|nr:hypothetical protein HIM_00943 [Hirsutella minnesotensis 3608]